MAEKTGIALMRSGSYVLRNLDKGKLDAFRRADLRKVCFSPEPSVVVTNSKSRSKRGKLARFAFLSADGRLAKYPDRIFSSRSSVVSLELIKAAAHTPRDFIALISANETLHIRRKADGREWFGVLFGSDSDTYSSLVVDADTPAGFDFVDIETELNAYNSHAVVSVLRRNPPQAESVRVSILRKYQLHTE